jgi:hypothetical protein
MRRLLLVTSLLFLSFYCFAQQNVPGKIIGKIPDKNSPKKYEIQVGAFTVERNAEQALAQLRRNALNPVKEQYLHFTRVMIKGIPADQVVNFLVVIKQAGFNEVIIRESTAASVTPVTSAASVNSISEKWEIITPDSDFESFEFNHDMNYIAIEYNGDVYFGEYTMPNNDTINMDKLGTVNITRNDGEVRFIFIPINDPGRKINLSAVKTEQIPLSPELDLFCRTWKVINCTNPEFIGNYLLISNTGTYFFTTPDGESHSLSTWRWYGDNHKEFEYSHELWEYYGRAKITSLTQNFLGIFDPGYLKITPGYSNAHMDVEWELVPVQD